MGGGDSRRRRGWPASESATPPSPSRPPESPARGSARGRGRARMCARACARPSRSSTRPEPADAPAIDIHQRPAGRAVPAFPGARARLFCGAPARGGAPLCRPAALPLAKGETPSQSGKRLHKGVSSRPAPLPAPAQGSARAARPLARPPARSAATGNVRTQEAVEVLAVFRARPPGAPPWRRGPRQRSGRGPAVRGGGRGLAEHHHGDLTADVTEDATRGRD